MDQEMRKIVAGLRVSAAELGPGEQRDTLVRLAKRLSTAQYGGDPGLGGGGGDPLGGGGDPGVGGPAAAGPAGGMPDDEEAAGGYSGTPGGLTDPNRAPRQYWALVLNNIPALTYEDAVAVGRKIQELINSSGGEELSGVNFDGVPKSLRTDNPQSKGK